jgi:uncharacterized membrane protein
MNLPDLLFEHAAPATAIGAALLAAAGLTALSFVRHIPGRGLRLALLALRLIFLALVGWCLLLPMARRVASDAVRPHFVVALDTSASMARRPALPGTPTRWAAASRLLAQGWVRRLQSDCVVDVFAFNTRVEPPLSPSAVSRLKPDGRGTHLRDSLRGILDRFRGQDLAGLVLLSDGADTRELDDAWAASRWPCPIYTVRLEPPGSMAIEPDVRIDTVNTPRRAVAGWDTKLTATVAGQGADAAPCRVDLLENGRLIDSAPAPLDASGDSREVSFRLVHPEVGSTVYTVAIPPLPGETRTNDNAYSVTVQTVDARNRVLYAETVPRWESKYLNRELLANRNITPASFVRGPDGRFLAYGERGEASLDMTATQLARYKIVILGDLDAGTLGEARAAALVKFVEDGGSLVLLGGPAAWRDQGFAATALERLLPCRRAWETPAAEGLFPVSLTDEGRAHGIFAGDAKVGADLPPVLSVFPGARPTPGASVLAAAQTPEGRQPLIVAHPYGQGKVLAVLTDSLWRWQLAPGQTRPYARFWSQALEWLSPAATELDRYELDCFADTAQLTLGEAITLKARVSGRAPPGAEWAAVCTVETPDNRPLPLDMKRQEVESAGARTPGAVADFTPRAAGLHRAIARADIGGARYESAPFTFFVKSVTPEDTPRPINERLLRALAENSGGRFCEPDELDPAISRLEIQGREEQRVLYASLWQRLPLLACLMALLGLEWILRKVRNLA